MSELTIQFPDPTVEGLKRIADRDSISVEQYLSKLAADAVRQDEFWEERLRRGRLVSRERFLEILRKVPDVEPEPLDRIE